VLISSAPGLGKTALLSAVSETADGRAQRVAWVSGSVIASERHFAGALARVLGVELPEQGSWGEQIAEVLRRSRAQRPSRTVLILDDLDQLVFKREALLELLADLLDRCECLLLIATAKPIAISRIAGSGKPFGGRFLVVPLRLLDREAGIGLVRLRAPQVPSAFAEQLYEQAGGHPAALVFLARLVTLAGSLETETSDRRTAWDRAAEFAGAVYAQQWSTLGPQQRAILWELAAAPGAEGSPTELAMVLGLPPSHVGVQLKRLGDEALVGPGTRRGRYRISPLLARWISERAIRTTA
jgi:DNA-binding transcriptional ArsR family regulator